MTGLYVHIPFCVRKCAYCDFYSVSDRRHLIPAYVDAVLDEAQAYTGLGFRTLYLGGGTPSIMDGTLLETLIRGLGRLLDFSALQEATMELNPESTSADLLKTARDLGFNRVSIGVQSFSDHELASANRIHDSAQALKALSLAGQAGFQRISADLICGLPGQDWTSLGQSLRMLVDCGVGHVSMYCLSVEPGTPLACELPPDLPDDDAQADLYNRARAFLRAEGFLHYEISNFARPGAECQHNLNYWRGGEYLGLGAAAASHLCGCRFRNRATLSAYLEDPHGVLEEFERLEGPRKAAEEAMLRLRLLSEGINPNRMGGRYTGADLALLRRRLGMMEHEGLLLCDDGTFRLPPNRILTSNPVFARLLE